MKNITRAKGAYWAHKANAKARGKDRKFTLEEWINWWGVGQRNEAVENQNM